MAVRKLQGRYTVEFELRGHRIFRRLPSGATKAQAEELELKLRRELIDQSVLGKAPKVSLHYCIGQWRDAKVREGDRETRSKAKLVLEGIEKLKLKDAPLQEVQSVAGELIDLWGGLAPATINRRLSAIKSTCKWAWKVKRWSPTNLSPHVELLPGEKVRTRVITQQEIDRLISKAPDKQTQAFIALGSYGLMRQGEVMKLTKHSELKILAQSKGGPMRALEVVEQLKPHLRALPLTLHVRTLYGRFEAARDASGIEDLIYHDLRRSGATILLNRGVPLEVVSHILGHKSLETTRKIYAHVLTETVRKAMRKGFKPIKNPKGKGGPGGI